MQGQSSLLFWGLDGDEAHVGPRHRLTDGFGIVGVVFSTLAVGHHELGRDHPYRVTQLGNLACPMRGTATGFDANETRWQISQGIQELGPSDRLYLRSFTVPVDTVQLKNILRYINAYGRNIFHGMNILIQWAPIVASDRGWGKGTFIPLLHS